MNNKIIFLIAIIFISYYQCSTPFENESVIPTAPTSSYSIGTNTPSAATFAIGWYGSSGNLQAVLCWQPAGNSVETYNILRDNSLIYSFNKKDKSLDDIGFPVYFYVDTATSQGEHYYKIQTIGVSGKARTNNSIVIGCTNYSSKGDVRGTYYDIDATIPQKIYIGGAVVFADNGSGKMAYTKTDADGNFSISGLPTASYTINFYHPNYINIPISVTITSGVTKTTNVEYPF